MANQRKNIPHGGEFDPFHHGDDWLNEDPNDPFVGHYTDDTGCHPIRQSEMEARKPEIEADQAKWKASPKVAYVDHRTSKAEADELLEEQGRESTVVVFREPEPDEIPNMLSPVVIMDARLVNAKDHRELSGRDEDPPTLPDASRPSPEPPDGDSRASEQPERQREDGDDADPDAPPVTEMLADLGAEVASRLTALASDTAAEVAERAKTLSDLASDTASTAAERAKTLGKAAQDLTTRLLGADESRSRGDDAPPSDSGSRDAPNSARQKRPFSERGPAAGADDRGGANGPGRSRWDGRLATSADGQVNLHETIYQHLLREYGPGASSERRNHRRHRPGPNSDGRERFFGTEREGIAPGLGYMRSFAAARGLDMDANGQFVGHEDLQKGAPQMEMITTHLSSYGAKAAADPKLYNSPIALNLPDVAPTLLSWLEGVSAEAVPGKPSRWGRTEIEQTLEREVMMLTGKFGTPTGGVTEQLRAKAKAWEQVLEGACQSVPVPLVPDLIRSCDITALAHDACGHQGGSEHHQDGHRRMAASWRCLAAYLAARLDAVGRHMSPALMFARD